MCNPREQLERFEKGVAVLQKELPDAVGNLFGFIQTAQREGALTVREKELIAIGISLYHRCEDCIVVHVRNALQAGCTRQEILEAAAMAIVFGGGPSLGASATLLIEALDEFAKDYRN